MSYKKSRIYYLQEYKMKGTNKVSDIRSQYPPSLAQTDKPDQSTMVDIPLNSNTNDKEQSETERYAS